MITTSTGDWDFGFYWSMSFWMLIPAAIGMLIGIMAQKEREKGSRGVSFMIFLNQLTSAIIQTAVLTLITFVFYLLKN